MISLISFVVSSAKNNTVTVNYRDLARLITGTRRCDHITPVLRQLHWLPVRQRVGFKIVTLVHQSLSGHIPSYLADDCRLVTDARATRTLAVGRTQRTFGDRTFAAEASRLWNSLPPRLVNIEVSSIADILSPIFFEYRLSYRQYF